MLGDLVEVTCDGCGLEREDAIGVGMSGVARDLCVCSSCDSLVVVERECVFDAIRGLEPSPLRCPTCGSEVAPVADGDPCPCGDGTLHLAPVGLWD